MRTSKSLHKKTAGVVVEQRSGRQERLLVPYRKRAALVLDASCADLLQALQNDYALSYPLIFCHSRGGLSADRNTHVCEQIEAG